MATIRIFLSRSQEAELQQGASIKRFKTGAGNRVRTDDLLITNLLVPGIHSTGETRVFIDSFSFTEAGSRRLYSLQINAD